VTATVGPRLNLNELKSIFAAEPIMIFGGSPISVAAPPMFEARAWAIINRMGDILKMLNIEIVTGTISNIVVTLSMNMETMAVNVHKQ
jgi:hypothetical protein